MQLYLENLSETVSTRRGLSPALTVLAREGLLADGLLHEVKVLWHRPRVPRSNRPTRLIANLQPETSFVIVRIMNIRNEDGWSAVGTDGQPQFSKLIIRIGAKAALACRIAAIRILKVAIQRIPEAGREFFMEGVAHRQERGMTLYVVIGATRNQPPHHGPQFGFRGCLVAHLRQPRHCSVPDEQGRRKRIHGCERLDWERDTPRSCRREVDR